LLFFLPDGKTLVSTDVVDKSTHYWDVSKGKEQRDPVKQVDYVRAVSPDGRYYAVSVEWTETAPNGPLNGVPKVRTVVRESETDREICKLDGIRPTPGMFSPDGKAIASNDQYWGEPDREKTFELLELASGKVRRRFTGHRSPIDQFAFSRDSSQCVSVGMDKTAVVWDLTGMPADSPHRREKLSAAELHGLWKVLGDEDAAGAYDAIWSLAAAPRDSVPFLKEHLRAVAPVEGKRLDALIADLNKEGFETRQKATADLEKLGDVAEPALRKALKADPPVETRERIERLLEKLNWPITHRDRLQSLRGIEALEHTGTEESRRVLEDLSKGAAEASLTKEARWSLERMGKIGIHVPKPGEK
jgi:hypothetical protein